MSKTISLSLLCLVALCILEASSSPNRICGNQITNVLTVLCRHGFNRIIQKRDTSMMDLDPLDPIQYTQDMESPADANDLVIYPVDNRRMFNLFQTDPLSSLTGTRRRARNGIVEECCDKGCTYNELKAYCKR